MRIVSQRMLMEFDSVKEQEEYEVGIATEGYRILDRGRSETSDSVYTIVFVGEMNFDSIIIVDGETSQ